MQPTYDQWIAVGLANNFIDKRFVGQFAPIIQELLKQHYQDNIKTITQISEPKLVQQLDVAAAFAENAKKILPHLSSLPPLQQQYNYNSSYGMPKIQHKPIELMTHHEKRMFFRCPPDGSHGVCIDWLKGNYCDSRCTMRHGIYTGFKSRLCKQWVEGHCRFEDIKCGYAHGEDDIFNRETMTTKYSNRKIVFSKYDNLKDIENAENLIWEHFQESNVTT